MGRDLAKRNTKDLRSYCENQLWREPLLLMVRKQFAPQLNFLASNDDASCIQRAIDSLLEQADDRFLALKHILEATERSKDQFGSQDNKARGLSRVYRDLFMPLAKSSDWPICCTLLSLLCTIPKLNSALQFEQLIAVARLHHYAVDSARLELAARAMCDCVMIRPRVMFTHLSVREYLESKDCDFRGDIDFPQAEKLWACAQLLSIPQARRLTESNLAAAHAICAMHGHRADFDVPDVGNLPSVQLPFPSTTLDSVIESCRTLALVSEGNLALLL
jgi:hypothetical protein